MVIDIPNNRLVEELLEQFDVVSGLLEIYQKQETLTSLQADQLQELRRRIRQLKQNTLEISDKLGKLLVLQHNLFSRFPITFNPAIPNTQVKFDNASFGGTPGSEMLLTEEERLILDDVWMKTEDWYNSAHRVLDIITFVTSEKNFNVKTVRIIRNHLVVHPEKYHSNKPRIPDTFSWDYVNGPILKGTVVNDNQYSFQDKGLYINAKELLTEIKLLFMTKKFHTPLTTL